MTSTVAARSARSTVSNTDVSVPTGIRPTLASTPGTSPKTSRMRPSISPFSANTRAAPARARSASRCDRASFLTTYSMALPCGSTAYGAPPRRRARPAAGAIRTVWLTTHPATPSAWATASSTRALRSR